MHNGNWFAVSRMIFEHYVVGAGQPVAPRDPKRGAYSKMEAWLWLVASAAYEPRKVMNKGREMELQPGQLMGAYSYLSEQWNWTPETVRWFLKRLETTAMITRYCHTQRASRNTNQSQVLSVCNYSQYQITKETEPQPTQQAEPQADNKPTPSQQHESNNRQITNTPPLPPQGGGQEQDDFHLEPTDDPKARRAAERKRLIDSAVSLYNRAAEHWGLSVCKSVTSARAGRIEKRLADIGGLENFRLALRAIGKDDFLMGRKPARPGEQPFRLTIDRLLSTETSMGDVLARLLDQATEPEQDSLVGPNGKRWGWWRGKEDQLRDLPIDWWRKALESAKPNGTWPWWILTAPPGHDECLMPKSIVDEHRFAETFKGQITHA